MKTILVNGYPKPIASSTLSYEDVVALAGKRLDVHTVTWRRGSRFGSLAKGERLDVQEGIAFSVALTVRS